MSTVNPLTSDSSETASSTDDAVQTDDPTTLSPGTSTYVNQQLGTGDETTSPEEVDGEVSEGRWLDRSDNSVAISNDAYVGTSPEYQNYADDTQAPSLSEDDATRAIEEQAVETEEALKRPVSATNTRLTYDPETPHPSERTKPQDAYIEGNRALMEKAVNDAKS